MSNKRVVQNILLVFSSEGIGGILSFVIVLLSARLLGVDSFGVFSYILAITSVCQLVADFGLTNLIVREIAKDKSKSEYIMSNVLSLAWILSLLILAVVVTVSYVTLESQDEILAACLMGLAVLATYHSVVYSSVCRAYERMGYNAFSFVVHKVILLGFILFFTSSFSPVESQLLGIAIAYLIANLCQYLFFFVVVTRHFITFSFGRDVKFCIQLLRDAVPIGASMVIRRLTLQVDILILTFIALPSAVGVFSAAYKVVQVVDMIPFAICLPLFPALSRLASTDLKQLNTFFANSLTGFLIVSIPISGLLILSAENLVMMFYGDEYSNAGPVLKVLAFSIVGLFVNMLLSYLFISLNKQRFYLYSAAACLGINAIVDFTLIPFWGELGAAWGTIAGELSYFALCVFFLKQVNIQYAWVKHTWRPILLAVMDVWLCSFILEEGIKSQILVSILYVAFYILGLFVLRVLTLAQVKQVVGSILAKQVQKDKQQKSTESGLN
ncbi:flippase [Paraglaciecola marina]|uniref:flippase n=1 Tax=Paraglaciecola marina TaxID=2500157 RepID=UPI00105BBDD9|nr:flippase [Paraglaciecola marina]